MNWKILTAASLLAVILLVGGVGWYGEKQKTPEVSVRPDRQETSQTEASETENLEMMFDDQGRELVWYEIPELGIRFKVTPDTWEELIYYKNPGLNIVYFSTKTLSKLSSACAAEYGPAGALSFVSIEEMKSEGISQSAPCGGGKKVYEYQGGYFCFTLPQAPCLDKAEYEKHQSIIRAHNMNIDFDTEERWKTIEVGW